MYGEILSSDKQLRFSGSAGYQNFVIALVGDSTWIGDAFVADYVADGLSSIDGEVRLSVYRDSSGESPTNIFSKDTISIIRNGDVISIDGTGFGDIYFYYTSSRAKYIGVFW